MGFSNVIGVGLACALCLPAAAQANCRVCDEVVELDATLAACLSRQFDALEGAVASAPHGRLKIDLSGCKGVETDGDRGGLLTMPSLTGAPRKLKTVFIFDLASLQCLRGLLTNIEGPIDPTVTFDLYAQCDR